MVTKPTCEFCQKDAIGIQSFESSCAYVCLDHADPLLLELKPGEKKGYGGCYLERYETTNN